MPHRRVPRLPSLVGPLGVALALAAVLALAPHASSTIYAQEGPDFEQVSGPGGFGPMFGPGRGPGARGADGLAGLALTGQTQMCQQAPGAALNYRFDSPVLVNYNVIPPYGGSFAMYTGTGLVCMWIPQ